MAVVVREPGQQSAAPVAVVLVAGGVGPFDLEGLDEPLGFAVGSGSVGAGARMADLEVVHGGGVEPGAVSVMTRCTITPWAENQATARRRNPTQVAAFSSSRIST